MRDAARKKLARLKYKHTKESKMLEIKTSCDEVLTELIILSALVAEAGGNHGSLVVDAVLNVLTAVEA